MKQIGKMFIAVMLMAFAGPRSYAQIIVNIRPERPRVVVARPVAPSPRHVWVEEEWVPQGGTYVFHGGYWSAPIRPGAMYIPGHWKNTRHGWVWRPGHWR
ncbi:hypothetical protein [Parasediminibacterium sp. JCM 36343]|uniref:hypothetical protein n=1 Tax=Parasediminibacterium sp. JCM 36343 TaxID=3374279 RepID=UPI00397C3D5C